MIEHIIRKFNPNVCYDIGAHDGSFSQLLHRILPLATIHQFEGSPNKFQKVKWGTWHKVLLSDKDDITKTFYHDGGTGDTYMVETPEFLKSKYQSTLLYYVFGMPSGGYGRAHRPCYLSPSAARAFHLRTF